MQFQDQNHSVITVMAMKKDIMRLEESDIKLCLPQKPTKPGVSLPGMALPTYLEVRNLVNNKTIIVRVNDRGPFIDNLLIDLSYAAALKLDIVKNGTAQVEIRTVTEKNDDLDKNIDEEAYIQIGAFEEKENAYDYLKLLKDNKFNSANVRKEYNWLRPLSPTYKVQVGPIKNKKQHNELLSRLRKIGVYQTKIVTN